MKQRSQTIRIALLAGVFVLALLLYCLRLMQMQVVEGEDSAALLEKGWSSTQVIKAARGEILDRNGRPLAMNAIGRDVVINRAFLEPKETNAVILRLIRIMEEADEDWIDNLPITMEAPFAFKDQKVYATEITRLKNAFSLGQYATADDVVYHLKQTYNLESHGDPENPIPYTDEEFRKIAGVRYEMTQRGFSMAVPYTFATDIKIETVPKIKERSFEISGVDVVESPTRQYVSGDIAPHIIGRIGAIYKEEWDTMEKKTVSGQVYAARNGRTYQMNDVMGKEGAEQAFEQYLKGIDGERKIVQNARGDVIDIIEEKPAVPGNTVVLTIDSQLQKVAQDALVKEIRYLNETAPAGEGKEANAGAVAVTNVKTGEVLALVTYPSYNLSTFQQDYDALSKNELNPLWNRALYGSYMPGSIFKPVTAVGALAEGIVTPDSTYLCAMRYDRFAPFYFSCLGAHGVINVKEALKYSCNIYFYDAGFELGIDRIGQYAAGFGMGLPTGIELPESVGQVSSRTLKEKLHGEPWQDGDTVQTSIGQLDTRLTPLQLANYTTTLANKGKRMELTLLKAVKSYSFDETIQEHTPTVADEMDLPEWVFDTVHEGMVMASRTGTARGTLGSYPLDVASKTGTPETHAEPNSTFICFAPADDPEIAVTVVIEKGWHGYTGAPVARDIFNAYFFSQSSKSSAEPGYGTLLP